MTTAVLGADPTSRTTDPETSAMGAVTASYRANSDKHLLLGYFAEVGKAGDTSADAADAVGLFAPGVCYWKRVSELAQAGLITKAGTRISDATGTMQTVYRITPEGRTVLRQINKAAK